MPAKKCYFCYINKAGDEFIGFYAVDYIHISLGKWIAMKAPTKTDVPAAVEDSEMAILTQTGLPPIFAQFLKEKSETLGVAFALRASTPIQRYLMPAAPKPSCVKAKTGNWCFTKGVITVDPALGKTEKIAGKWQVIPRQPRDVPAEILQEVTHRLSLQEVLIGVNSGEYTLVGTWEDIEASSQLVVRAKYKYPYDSEFVFRINLAENKSRLEKQSPIDFSKMLSVLPQKPPQPSWWKSEWGTFTECLDYYYPAQYMRAHENDFQDVMVYGISDGSGKVLPITGDQDLLWITIPSKKHDALLKDFDVLYNTFETGGVEKLYHARLSLYLKLGGDPKFADAAISNSALAGMGTVTAYESYVIDEVNRAFAHSGVKHLRNLIQHAAENHNPEVLSPLDANMIHVWRGKVFMTHNENEIIQFIMQPEYPVENIVNVHSKWDMSKWAPFISLQLQLHQPVPTATFAAYQKHRQKTQSRFSFGVPGWPKNKENK
jgi:hypothetical protein